MLDKDNKELCQSIIMTNVLKVEFQYIILNMKDNNNNENITLLSPVHSYVNAGLQKNDICKSNKNKTGIYKWTHVISGKSYVGSSINLSNRFRNYYSLAYLKREITKNNSMIYRALLKYGHSSFKLDIIVWLLSYNEREFLLPFLFFYLIEKAGLRVEAPKIFSYLFQSSRNRLALPQLYSYSYLYF